MMIVNIDDFTGKFELHTGMYNQQKLIDYIERYEPIYLMQLLGSELYDEFISDLSVLNVPKSPNFLSIFNPFVENSCLKLYVSLGIKDMLTGFIYWEFAKDNISQQTINGAVRQTGENSDVSSTLYTTMCNRYNESVRTSRAIQNRIIRNISIAIGQCVEITILNGGSIYSDALNVPTINGTGNGLTIDVVTDGFGVVDSVTINQSGTKYLVGDTITIVGGANDAQCSVDYVGKGKFSTFKGVLKSYISWL
jgi:hypothetical protein